MSTRGRVLGARVHCKLCGRQRYLQGGTVRVLESPVAYPAYPRVDGVVWIEAGEPVCTWHMQLKPQPEQPAAIATEFRTR
jgi:hypothetical protein